MASAATTRSWWSKSTLDVIIGLVKKLSLAVLFICLIATALLADSTYPQIDVSGYKKWENKKVDVDNMRNYFNALSQLGGYYPTYSGGPWQERLQLRILGQLSEDLSVSYDLEQQPETPEKYDVKVKYKNTELSFGDLSATYAGNEFVSTTKFLNGVMLTSKDSWYDLILVPSSKLKSQTQNLTSQRGAATRGPYNLGHGSIVENSEFIQLNGVPQIRNIDYTIDYFEGKITFKNILNETDEFKYSYEYTNVLDLFFPSLSKRDFFGFQSRLTIDPDTFGKPEPKEEPLVASARETFPTQTTMESDIQAEESSGNYRLKNFPVIKFSETLTFMGSRLKKNEDYIIRYETGEIKLMTRFLPTNDDPLSVEYKFHQTAIVTDNINGVGSRGPYRTKHGRIVPESERLEVDGRLMVRGLEYNLDYTKGEIMLGMSLGPTSQIKITYKYNVTALPTQAVSKFPRELKMGVTYLKESAKKGTTSPMTSVTEVYTGQDLINNQYTLNLKNRPTTTSEAVMTVTLKQGGASRTLSFESEYILPTTYLDPTTGLVVVTPECQLAYITDHSDPTDGYGTGTLFFFNNALNLTPTDEITVAYSYKKSIISNYSGVGNGSKGPYYLKNIREIVPGSETLRVWDQGSSVTTIYTRNASFDANAGDTGYSINYNKDNAYITFNNELATTKNFQVIFQYIAPTVTSGGDISQVALGLDGSFKIGDALKIETAYARSETDQVYYAQATIESFNGNGSKNYLLHSSTDIIDGSEQIYVNNNLLNRDIDYFISYTKPGQFNFYYITPATADAISVQYNYQSTAGVDVGGKVKTDYAFRLGAETKLLNDSLVINGTTKKIGFDFSPLGGTPIGPGSENDEYNINYHPQWQGFTAGYAYKVNKNPIGTTRTTFMRTYDNIVSLGLNPNGLAKIDLGYRYYASLDDPLGVDGLNNSDNEQNAFSLSLTPTEIQRGILTFNQRYDLRKTVSRTDTVDRGANISVATIDYYHWATDLKFTDRLTAGYDFQYNQPVTLGSLETEIGHNHTVDNSYNFNLDLTMLFLQKWNARVAVQNHDEMRTLPTPEAATSTKNETYHMDIVPHQTINAALDHNRQERSAYVSGGENPLSLRTAGSARYSPLNWFSVGLTGSKGETIPETGGANKTTNRSLGYDLDYMPLSFQLIKLQTRFALTNADQTAPLGSERVLTETDTFTQNYILNLNPLPILPLTFGLGIEDYKNVNNSVTSPVSTETQNSTMTAAFTLTLPRLPQLTLGGDYNQKITRNTKTGDSRPKTVTNLKASYQLTSWGTLSYDLTEERNQGEIQGGIIADLDLKKATHNISLNITFPVNNPVLSNFTLIASLKQVVYNNFKNSLDDFRASLLSFEGAMNF